MQYHYIRTVKKYRHGLVFGYCYLLTGQRFFSREQLSQFTVGTEDLRRIVHCGLRECEGFETSQRGGEEKIGYSLNNYQINSMCESEGEGGCKLVVGFGQLNLSCCYLAVGFGRP
jgi:hypothetical protein